MWTGWQTCLSGMAFGRRSYTEKKSKTARRLHEARRGPGREERTSVGKKETRRRLSERVAQELDVPLDAMTLLPRIECIGDRELTVEGHRGLLEYGETCIRLSGGSIVLNIQGQGLELTGMTPTRARVSGAIKKLCFERA